MADKQRVKLGLECCTAWSGMSQCKPVVGQGCPYDEEADCKLRLMEDVLELIREQERKCRAIKETINREIEKAILYGDGMSVESSIWDERDA